MNKSPDQKIADWFEKPVKHLEKTYGPDAGFIPLTLSFALVERLLTHLIVKDGKCKKSALPEYLHKILGVDLEIAAIFWNMYRDGTMHCGQPYSGKLMGERDWGWEISDKHLALPQKLENPEMGKLIAINPWEWFYHVVQTYAQHPEVASLTDLRKLGEIGDKEESQPPIFRNEGNIEHTNKVQTTQSQTGIYYPKSLQHPGIQ